MNNADRELFLGLGTVFSALHELPNSTSQEDRRRMRAQYLFELQSEAKCNYTLAQIRSLIDAELGDVPDSMGAEAIFAAYSALSQRDESRPALVELRQRLGPAASILDGEGAAQELLKRPSEASKS